jgi:hypothetical protein
VQTTNDSPNQYAWRAGVAIWCGFHHGTILGTAFGGMGMIDHARLPLRRWYYYRNKYLGIAPPTWPTAGTASRLRLTTDITTITDDGTTDCQLIVQVQDASGNWISNQPNITLTDRNGLGLFPGGTSITFTGGAIDKGVIEGLAAIEYRSYNAGTAYIDATSPGLTMSTVTITVNQSTAVAPSMAALQNQFYPMSQIVKTVGNRIVIPQAKQGKKVMASVYDLQGRMLLSKIVLGQNFIDLAGKSLGSKVLLVKTRVLE